MKKSLACLLVLFSSLVTAYPYKESAEDKEIHRQRRNLVQFASMVSCATNRSPTDFNGYGCWCGLGGKGTPVDELDQCCYVHDHCYKSVRTSGVCTFPWSAYTAIYTRKGCTGCDESNEKCKMAVCECDGEAARCFAQAEFNTKYKGYPQDKCT